MGVEHKSVTLVGADESVFSFDNLTQKGLDFIADLKGDSNDLEDFFNENKHDMLFEFGIEDMIGSLWTGRVSYLGVEVSVGLNKNYQDEINHILQWFDIESDLDIHSGVYEF